MNNDFLKNFDVDDTRSSLGLAKMDIKKYLRLIWKKKFWIFLIAIFLTAPWLVVASFLLKKIDYTSSSVIRFNDPRGVSAVTDFTIMNTFSKLAVLKTRSFLGRVVDSLHYNLIFKSHDINPSKFVHSFEILPDAKFGNYEIAKELNSLVVTYSNDKEEIEDEVVKKIPITSDSTILLEGNGLRIGFDREILLGFDVTEFSLVPTDNAISMLIENLNTQLDVSHTILTISYKDKNPEYSALVVNTISDLFVQQLLDYKRMQTTSILTPLEEQLQAARKELDSAEEEIKTFRKAYPLVFLETDRKRMVSQYADLEGEIDANNKNIYEINQLLEKMQQGIAGQDKSFIIRDILSFLQAENLPGASSLIQQYDQLVGQKQRLIQQNYPLEHPQVIDANNKIREMEDQITQKAIQYRNQTKGDIDVAKSDINSLYNNLKNLPRNELRLAELERNLQIKDKIVSTLMTRIDEAKINDAAIIPDAYIIDRAFPPIITSLLFLKIRLYGIGPLLGIIIGIIFFVLLDVLDNSVKSSKDVEKKLRLPILASIPIIGNLKEVPENGPLDKKFDRKLITSDYSPNLASESFRFLRTKLNIMNDKSHKAFIVVSLNPGEGKSLAASNLAITFAQQKFPTLLVDCDLRRGVLHNSFAGKKAPGLTDLLMGDSDINISDAKKIIQQTHIPNLSLLSSGKQIPNPSELLGSLRMQNFYKKLKRPYKVIIFDTPPIEFIPDAFVLNTFIHSLILVVRYGKTNLNRMNDVISDFDSVKKDFLGVVVNASPLEHEKKYYSYSYYKY
jgi:succinoglycan biosynthesis transport protein ExoP